MSLAKPYSLVVPGQPASSPPPLPADPASTAIVATPPALTKSPSLPWPALPKSPPFRVG